MGLCGPIVLFLCTFAARVRFLSTRFLEWGCTVPQNAWSLGCSGKKKRPENLSNLIFSRKEYILFAHAAEEANSISPKGRFSVGHDPQAQICTYKNLKQLGQKAPLKITLQAFSVFTQDSGLCKPAYQWILMQRGIFEPHNPLPRWHQHFHCLGALCMHCSPPTPKTAESGHTDTCMHRYGWISCFI